MLDEMQASLTNEGLSFENVTVWNGRPKRQRRAPPKTYWEEYVETDAWYKKKLIEDVPPDEMWAALEDEDLRDVGEEGDDDVDTGEEDDEWSEPIAPGALSPDEIPSDDEESDESGDATEATDDDETTSEVHGPSEGE